MYLALLCAVAVAVGVAAIVSVKYLQRVLKKFGM
jgi:hypothetical protein